VFQKTKDLYHDHVELLTILAFFYHSVRLLSYSIKHATATGVQNHLLTVGLKLTLKKAKQALKSNPPLKQQALSHSFLILKSAININPFSFYTI